MTENENTTYDLFDEPKTVLRGKLITLNAYISREERSKLSN